MARTHARFCIVGHDALDEITAAVGIPPTESWRRGDPAPYRPGAQRPHSLWALASGCRDDADVDTHVAALLTLLEPRAAAVRAAATRYEAMLQLVLYSEGANPGVRLPAPLLARIAALGASVDVDVYCLGEPEGEIEAPTS